jgi:hypothetical protein
MLSHQAPLWASMWTETLTERGQCGELPSLIAYDGTDDTHNIFFTILF